MMSGSKSGERFAGGKGGLDSDRRRENRFAKHDQRQEAVSFGDVLRMPRRRRGPLRPDRHHQFERREQEEAGHPQARNPQHADPRDLHDRDSERVSPRRDAMARIRRRRPQPLRDHGHPHHDIAGNRGEVGHAVLEHRRHACRQDERAGDLHEHREPVRHVVAVVRRREPREVHPRPPDREEDHQESEEALERVSFADRMVQPARRLGDRDDEDEIEEELERCRRAVGLVR